MKRTDLYPPGSIIWGALNDDSDCINQLLKFYDCNIKQQVQKLIYFQDSIYSKEDVTQEINLEIVKSIKNLKIKLDDKEFLLFLHNRNNG